MGFFDSLLSYLPQTQSGETDFGKIGGYGSMGLGAAGLITNALEANRRLGLQKEMQRAVQNPVSPDAFYQPMTDIEQRMLRNSLAAEQGQAGLGDSAYGRYNIAESMAKTQAQRYQDAIKAAQQAQQTRLQGYGGYGGMNMLSPGQMQWGDPFKAMADYQAQRTLAAQRGKFENLYGMNGPALTYNPATVGQQYNTSQPSFNMSGLDLSNIPNVSQGEFTGPTGFYPNQMN